MAPAHSYLLVAAMGALINNTIKISNTTECTVTSLIQFWKDASKVKLNHFYGGIKGITPEGLLFMDTVNARVGSRFSVDISLITVSFPFP